MPDYEAMSGAEFQRAVGDDPDKWADAASQNAVTQGYTVDRDWLRVWFGDAMASCVRPIREILEEHGA